ncbi:MAG: hypothetical protein ACR2H6_08985 [Pyrinomonadaceae bacterium]
MKRNQKLFASKILLIAAAAAAFVLFGWDFTPRTSMKSKGKGQDEARVAARVSSAAKYRSPGNVHKVIVSDRTLAKSIESEGARLIADYGTFKLLEVNDALAGSLNDKPGAEFSDESNLIMLNSGVFDTTTAEVQRLRQHAGGFGGKRMHLVQFAGPIKPEWYSALLSTGVEIVTYIPSNAYLIYGTSGSIQQAQSLSAPLQWDGEYTEKFPPTPPQTPLPLKGLKPLACPKTQEIMRQTLNLSQRWQARLAFCQCVADLVRKIW